MGTCRWSKYLSKFLKKIIKYLNILKSMLNNIWLNSKLRFHFYPLLHTGLFFTKYLSKRLCTFVYKVTRFNICEFLAKLLIVLKIIGEQIIIFINTHKFKIKLFYFNIKQIIRLSFCKYTNGTFINKFLYFLTLLLTLSMFLIFIVFSINNSLFYKFLYKYVIIICFIYFLISTFVNITKQNMHGKYTSSIQRFWKRSYYLFWILEFFLFSIFIFLTCIHFGESSLFLDWKFLYSIYFDNSSSFFFYLILIQLLGVLNYYLIFFYKFNNFSIINIILLSMLLIFYIIIFYEFSKFFYVINTLSDSNLLVKTLHITTTKFQLFDELENILKNRTVDFYICLFILLKFWHVLFILLHFFFLVRNYLYKNRLSVDLVSSNLQNCMYLYWFNLLSMFLFFKNILIFNFQYSFYAFFLNLNFSNFLIFFIHEFLNLFIL